jgi:hypothetical protein
MQFQNKQILEVHMDSQNSLRPKLLKGGTLFFIIYFISHHVSDIPMAFPWNSQKWKSWNSQVLTIEILGSHNPFKMYPIGMI